MGTVWPTVRVIPWKNCLHLAELFLHPASVTASPAYGVELNAVTRCHDGSPATATCASQLFWKPATGSLTAPSLFNGWVWFAGQNHVLFVVVSSHLMLKHRAKYYCYRMTSKQRIVGQNGSCALFNMNEFARECVMKYSLLFNTLAEPDRSCKFINGFALGWAT